MENTDKFQVLDDSIGFDGQISPYVVGAGDTNKYNKNFVSYYQLKPTFN